jgi:hypothetical protein
VLARLFYHKIANPYTSVPHFTILHECERLVARQKINRREGKEFSFSTSAKLRRIEPLGTWDPDFIGSGVFRQKKELTPAIVRALGGCQEILKRKGPPRPEHVENMVYFLMRAINMVEEQTQGVNPVREKRRAVTKQWLRDQSSAGKIGLHASTALPKNRQIRELYTHIPVEVLLVRGELLEDQLAVIYQGIYDWTGRNLRHPRGNIPATFFERIREVLGGLDITKTTFDKEGAARIINDLKELRGRD